MKGNPKVIKILNELLADELTTVSQSINNLTGDCRLKPAEECENRLAVLQYLTEGRINSTLVLG